MAYIMLKFINPTEGDIGVNLNMCGISKDTLKLALATFDGETIVELETFSKQFAERWTEGDFDPEVLHNFEEVIETGSIKIEKFYSKENTIVEKQLLLCTAN